MKYFDYTSTTPLHPELLKTYNELLGKYYINSESLYPEGEEVNRLMEKSRSITASLLGVHPKEIIFTSGGSESNNTAIKGVALARKDIGKHIITTSIEHSSVYNSCRWLHDYLGYEITYLKVNQDGVIDVNELEKAIREDTILVSIMYVNNETGAIQPIDEVKKIVRKHHNTYLHVDCVQALGKMEIDLKDIDLASFSAHKINGLKGAGLLMKKQHVMMAELISAGQQENHLRGGTSNACTNILWGKTLRLALDSLQQHQQVVTQLHDYLYDLLENTEGIVLNSARNGSPYIINFSALNVTSQVMMNALVMKGFEVSAVSTCDSNEAISRVVAQMYSDEKRLKGTIRVSISYQHTKQDVDELYQAIREIISEYGIN